MTQFVFVDPGQSNLVPSGPQFGVRFTLTNAQGVRCVFNDPSDMDYVGWLTDVSGLDSPDLRENADDLVGDDGGVHGDFFYSRRPLVLSGQIESRPDNVKRNLRMTTLQRASNAMRQDATLRWMPEGGVEQILNVRRQQPLRISGSYNKTFQLSLVSADPRIYSAAIKETRIAPNVSAPIENVGSMQTPPDIIVNGPATNIQIKNLSTGENIVFTAAYAITAGQKLIISAANRTVLRENSSNQYSQLQYASTTWWQLQPGVNNLTWTATGTDANSSMIVDWRDAWV